MEKDIEIMRGKEAGTLKIIERRFPVFHLRIDSSPLEVEVSNRRSGGIINTSREADQDPDHNGSPKRFGVNWKMGGGRFRLSQGRLFGMIEDLQKSDGDPEKDSRGRILKVKIEKRLNQGRKDPHR